MKTSIPLLCIAVISISITTARSAVDSTPPPGEPPPTPNYQLVFNDNFLTDPNSNGKWTIFRRQHDLNNEGYWDATNHVWYLTRPENNLAIAAFANYELTARNWKVDFKYRIDNGPAGADGIVFMFYKDKSAYGVPDSGTYMGFQTRNRDGSDNPVTGYGLTFDTYQYSGCDPIQRQNYVAVVEDTICNADIYQPCTKIDDNQWHLVELTFDDGHLALTIDRQTVSGFSLCKPNSSFTGIGFGAGTGSNVSNQIIDDFEIWVAHPDN
jgi:hypothetical protein